MSTKINKTTGKQSGLTVNIPFIIKKQIDEAFSDFTRTDIPKIYFIVYKIASQLDKQVNNKDYTSMLGLTGGKFTRILSTLKQEMIIMGGTGASKGYTSNTYNIVREYDFNSSNNFQLHYYNSQRNLPIWVQKYLCDGYTVKNTSKSSFSKPAKATNKPSAKQSMQIEIDALKAKIIDLEYQLTITNDFINQDYIQDVIKNLSL
ncbi:hypothetical protein [Pedobacter sp. L105]|uniref:hypothetical protein n=1 Tax=Pedobacter sp. L105 TaxID=1641871 RepID=UPI00131B6EA6|nr:hypothetical protein [Pedobacter sp. L105]